MDPRKDLIEENCRALERKLDKKIVNRNEIIEHIVIIQEMMPKIKEYFSHHNNIDKQKAVIDFIYQHCPNAKNSILATKEVRSMLRRNGIISRNEFIIIDGILKGILGLLITFLLYIVGFLSHFDAMNFFLITAVIVIFFDKIFNKINFYRLK